MSRLRKVSSRLSLSWEGIIKKLTFIFENIFVFFEYIYMKLYFICKIKNKNKYYLFFIFL